MSTSTPPAGSDTEAIHRLHTAIARLLDASPIDSAGPKPKTLWQLTYRAMGRGINTEPGPIGSAVSGRVMIFPPPSVDLAFDDSILDSVKEVWKVVMGGDGNGHSVVRDSDFLVFGPRPVGGDGDGE